jgi:hypothetical protein
MNIRASVIALTLTFAFVSAVLIALPRTTGPQTVPLVINSSAGRALPVELKCDGITWQLYGPGTIADLAAAQCPPGSHYEWRPLENTIQ